MEENIKQKIVSLIQKKGKILGNEIIKDLDIKPNTANNYLSILAKERKIWRHEHGMYANYPPVETITEKKQVILPSQSKQKKELSQEELQVLGKFIQFIAELRKEHKTEIIGDAMKRAKEMLLT